MGRETSNFGGPWVAKAALDACYAVLIAHKSNELSTKVTNVLGMRVAVWICHLLAPILVERNHLQGSMYGGNNPRVVLDADESRGEMTL